MPSATDRGPRRERVALYLVRFVPPPLLENPERVLINVACVLMGLAALLGEFTDRIAQPPVLAGWGPWFVTEWAAAMILGGASALIGLWRRDPPYERFGALVLVAGSAIYGIAVLRTFGFVGIITALIFFGIAGAKVVRLIRSYALRARVQEYLRGNGNGD